MKEIKLSERDYSLIKDFAVQIWAAKTDTGAHFLAYCYVEAFIRYVTSKGWTIVNGRIYEKSN